MEIEIIFLNFEYLYEIWVVVDLGIRAPHRLEYTHELIETLDRQLAYFITTKCVLYMQLL